MKLLKATESQTIFTWNDEEFILDTENNPLHRMIENTCFDLMGVERSILSVSNTLARRLAEITEAVEKGNHASSVPDTVQLTELVTRRSEYYQELSRLVYLLKNL